MDFWLLKIVKRETRRNMHRESMSVVCTLFFLAKIIVDSVFLCGEGGALFSLKANNTLSHKIKRSEPSFYFFLF